MSAATTNDVARLLRIVAMCNDAGATARIVNCRVFIRPSPEADAVISKLIRDMTVEIEYPARDQTPPMPYIVRLQPVSAQQRRKRNNPTIL